MLITTLPWEKLLNQLEIVAIVSVILLATFVVNEGFAITPPTEIWFWNGQVVLDNNPQVIGRSGDFAPIHVDDIDCILTGNDFPNGFSRCYIFKSFNVTDVSGLNVSTSWLVDRGTSGLINIGEVRLQVRDGSYSTGQTDFPKNQTTPTSKGNGVIETIFEDAVGDPTVPLRTDNFNMPFANQSSTGFVTVFFELFDNDDQGGADFGQMHIRNFTITDFGSWIFGFNATSGEGSDVTQLSSQNCNPVQTNVRCGDYQFLPFPPSTIYGLTDLSDITAPVITLSGMNPQTSLQFVDYAEQGATCIDNIDGDITALNLVVDSSAVDTQTAGSYLVKYNCTDNSANANMATEVTRTFDVEKVRTSGGGRNEIGSGISDIGGEQGVDQLGEIPEALKPTRDIDVDRAFSLFDQLNSFFTPQRDVEPVRELEPELIRCEGGNVVDDISKCPQESRTQTTPSTDQTRAEQERGGFAQAISDFFSRLFGWPKEQIK